MLQVGKLRPRRAVPCSQHQELFPILLLSVFRPPHQARCFQFPLNPMLLLVTHVTYLFLPDPFQINGVSSANLSLSDTRQLIEKSEGELTLLVLRDSGQFLVNIPPAVSDSDSSLMEGEEGNSKLDSRRLRGMRTDLKPRKSTATQLALQGLHGSQCDNNAMTRCGPG